MDHFKREKAGEMQSLVLDFAQMQIAYNQRMEQQWQQLVPKLEALGGPPRAGGGGGAAAPAAAAEKPLPPLPPPAAATAPSREPAAEPPPADDTEDVVGV